GSASMTALDWAKYGQLIVQGGVWNGRRVLSKEGFGLLVQRKTRLDPALVLQRQVLDRIGVRAQWTRDQKGQPNLAGSASMTALDWAKYGQLIVQGGVWNGRRVLSKEG
ncbi:hypothetical protein CTI14_57150, partial [Methylobacterium radiotolerans]